MRHTGHRLTLLFLTAALLCCASGCFGVSHNPSYFPYLLPFGDVIRTHAKPIGPGYYADFDPNSIKLVVQPLEATSQVGTQHVLVATVQDEKDTPRRSRHIEWMVEGVGSLIEVDESGVFSGRGAKVTDKYGYSFTNYGEHRMTRGDKNKANDFMLRPGQTWCVLHSPVEGDTHVTVVASGIHNWERRLVRATVRWVDANWELPTDAVVKFGSVHTFTTKVYRHSDRKPLAGYKVRYKILPGAPAAHFLPERTQEVERTTDLSGNARVDIAQPQPASGKNLVSVDVIRPPDPTTPSGSGVNIVSGQASIEWLAPNVVLSHVGPDKAVVEGEASYTTIATNNGRFASAFLEIRNVIPENCEVVRTQPNAVRDGNVLNWAFGELPPGQSHQAQVVYRPKRVGPYRSVAQVTTAEKQADSKEVVTEVTEPKLEAKLVGPATGVVGVTLPYRIRLSNAGTGDLGPITLEATLDPGLKHAVVAGQVINSNQLPGIAPGQSRDEVFELVPVAEGTFKIKVKATGSGLVSEDNATVVVVKPAAALDVQGPLKSFVGRPAVWKIRVANTSPNVPLTSVVVRDRLPRELDFVEASNGGRFNSGEVMWNLGAIDPGKFIDLEVLTVCKEGAKDAVQVVELTADGNVRIEKQAGIEIQGIAAIERRLRDKEDPVVVGKTVEYILEIANTGSASANRIEVKATVPAGMRPISAKGPTAENIAGQIITFLPANGLQPGSKYTYVFYCEALKEGDYRFKTEVTTDAGENPPLIEEESTRILPALANPLQRENGPAPQPQVPPPPAAPPLMGTPTSNPPPPAAPGGNAPRVIPLPNG